MRVTPSAAGAAAVVAEAAAGRKVTGRPTRSRSRCRCKAAATLRARPAARCGEPVTRQRHLRATFAAGRRACTGAGSVVPPAPDAPKAGSNYTVWSSSPGEGQHFGPKE